MRTTRHLAIAALLMLPALAAAGDHRLTVYAGYRGGGNFTDAATEESLKLDYRGAVSLALDIPLDPERDYQIFVSHQRTDLVTDGTPFAGGSRLGMEITYLHFGGTYFMDGQVGRGPYVVGGLGVTLFNPDQGYSSELYPSLNVGFGYEVPLDDRFSLRAEARGYFTLVNSSGGVFCSGGCFVSIKADAVSQGELMLGLSARF